MVVPFVPFLIQGGGAIFTTTVSGQTARGLQIETVAASPFLLRERGAARIGDGRWRRRAAR